MPFCSCIRTTATRECNLLSLNYHCNFLYLRNSSMVYSDYILICLTENLQSFHSFLDLKSAISNIMFVVLFKVSSRSTRYRWCTVNTYLWINHQKNVIDHWWTNLTTALLILLSIWYQRTWQAQERPPGFPCANLICPLCMRLSWRHIDRSQQGLCHKKQL